jgi:tRNA(Ile2) C34 agmatinyltransferase TiaS
MMRFFVGIDDTDTVDADRGTGKLARWLGPRLPEGCRTTGVVRQQLLVDPRIPYTSHNSAACLIVEAEADLRGQMVERAVKLLAEHFLEGSDPGLCVAAEAEARRPSVLAFARNCTQQCLTQADARRPADGILLSAHGGTGDGIIGALAAVGLTASGWHGRFIDYRRVRELPQEVSVAQLAQEGIDVLSIDRDASVPAAVDRVLTFGWVRPRLMGGRAVLMVVPHGEGVWANLGRKRGCHGNGPSGQSSPCGDSEAAAA